MCCKIHPNRIKSVCVYIYIYLIVNTAVFRLQCLSVCGVPKCYLKKSWDAQDLCRLLFFSPSSPPSLFHLWSRFLHIISEMWSTCWLVLQHRSLSSSPFSLFIKVKVLFEVLSFAWAPYSAEPVTLPLYLLLGRDTLWHMCMGPVMLGTHPWTALVLSAG